MNTKDTPVGNAVEIKFSGVEIARDQDTFTISLSAGGPMFVRLSPHRLISGDILHFDLPLTQRAFITPIQAEPKKIQYWNSPNSRPSQPGIYEVASHTAPTMHWNGSEWRVIGGKGSYISTTQDLLWRDIQA